MRQKKQGHQDVQKRVFMPILVIIPMEDEILHTPDHPFCGNEDCICRQEDRQEDIPLEVRMHTCVCRTLEEGMSGL